MYYFICREYPLIFVWYPWDAATGKSDMKCIFCLHPPLATHKCNPRPESTSIDYHCSRRLRLFRCLQGAIRVGLGWHSLSRHVSISKVSEELSAGRHILWLRDHHQILPIKILDSSDNDSIFRQLSDFLLTRIKWKECTASRVQCSSSYLQHHRR